MARLFLLALILVPALAQGVRTGITPGEMEALLKAGSYRYERVEEGEGSTSTCGWQVSGRCSFSRTAGKEAARAFCSTRGFPQTIPPAWSG